MRSESQIREALARLPPQEAAVIAAERRRLREQEMARKCHSMGQLAKGRA